MRNLHTVAFICWLIAALGVTMRFTSVDSEGEPGGLFSYETYRTLSSAGLALFVIAVMAAVALHIIQSLRDRRDGGNDG